MIPNGFSFEFRFTGFSGSPSTPRRRPGGPPPPWTQRRPPPVPAHHGADPVPPAQLCSSIPAPPEPHHLTVTAPHWVNGNPMDHVPMGLGLTHWACHSVTLTHWVCDTVTRIKCTNGFVSWVRETGHSDFAAGKVKPEFHVFFEFGHVGRQSLCHSTQSTQSTKEPSNRN